MKVLNWIRENKNDFTNLILQSEADLIKYRFYLDKETIKENDIKNNTGNYSKLYFHTSHIARTFCFGSKTYTFNEANLMECYNHINERYITERLNIEHFKKALNRTKPLNVDELTKNVKNIDKIVLLYKNNLLNKKLLIIPKYRADDEYNKLVEIGLYTDREMDFYRRDKKYGLNGISLDKHQKLNKIEELINNYENKLNKAKNILKHIKNNETHNLKLYSDEWYCINNEDYNTLFRNLLN